MTRAELAGKIVNITNDYFEKGIDIVIAQGKDVDLYLAKLPRISFDLKGKTAGMVKTRYNDVNIRFNLDIASIPENTQNFLLRTIPHEVAHTFVSVYHPDADNHGSIWRRWMISLGAKWEDTTRCHNYAGVKRARKVTQYAYHCSRCSRDVWMGAIRHKKTQKQETLYLHNCGGKLPADEFTGKVRIQE